MELPCPDGPHSAHTSTCARGPDGQQRAPLRRIGRRDFFPPPERDRAHAAVRAQSEEPTASDGPETDDAGDVAPESTQHQEDKA
jgi:hypothetical protein